MMRRSYFSCILAALFPALVLGQVSTGAQPFGSIGGGPFDTANLGNLNVYFAIPVLRKAGRGIAFDYDLDYNSSVWYPVGSSGSQTWTPVFNWGWQSSYAANTGYLSASVNTVTCSWTNTRPPVPNGWVTTETSWAYHDPWGITHQFAGEIVFYLPTGACSGTNRNTFPATASDGSGYTLAANQKIITKGGVTLTPPFNPSYNTSSVNITDANGNEITSDSNGIFTDTLNTAALTVAGSPPSATTFKYSSSSGNVSYSMNFTRLQRENQFRLQRRSGIFCKRRVPGEQHRSAGRDAIQVFL